PYWWATDGKRQQTQDARRPAERAAGRLIPTHRFRCAAAGRDRLQLHAGADLQPAPGAHFGELHGGFPEFELYLLPLVTRLGRGNRRDPRVGLLSGGLWSRPGVRAL